MIYHSFFFSSLQKKWSGTLRWVLEQLSFSRSLNCWSILETMDIGGYNFEAVQNFFYVIGFSWKSQSMTKSATNCLQSTEPNLAYKNCFTGKIFPNVWNRTVKDHNLTKSHVILRAFLKIFRRLRSLATKIANSQLRSRGEFWATYKLMDEFVACLTT